jgi:hypothetical protein
LAEDDFKRLFSTFCLFSFLEWEIAFDETTAKKHLKNAKEFEDNINVDINNFLNDLHESISILLKDGTEYCFVHRSFQEYFVAIFLAERQTASVQEIIDAVLHSGNQVVAELLIEMNRDSFEEKYLIRHVTNLIREIKKQDVEDQHLKMLEILYEEIRISGNVISQIDLTQWHHIIQILIKHYDIDIKEDYFLYLVHDEAPIIQALNTVSNKRKKSFLRKIDASFPVEAIGPENRAFLADLRTKLLALEPKFKERAAKKEDLVARLLKKRTHH